MPEVPDATLSEDVVVWRSVTLIFLPPGER